MATREQMLRQQREKHLERAASSHKKAKQIEKMLAAEKRRKENRQKYIAGGYFLRALLENKTPCQSYEELLATLDRTLTKNIDRRAFDLPELPEKGKKPRKNAAKAQKVTPSKQPNSDRQPPATAKPKQALETSLPDSLVAATAQQRQSSSPEPAQNHQIQPSVAEPTQPQIPQPTKNKVLPERREEELIEEFNL
ncbi:MAG: hypothetical protein AAFY26_22335 [Cyanobacteria bacterium J06638_22]